MNELCEDNDFKEMLVSILNEVMRKSLYKRFDIHSIRNGNIYFMGYDNDGSSILSVIHFNMDELKFYDGWKSSRISMCNDMVRQRLRQTKFEFM